MNIFTEILKDLFEIVFEEVTGKQYYYQHKDIDGCYLRLRKGKNAVKETVFNIQRKLKHRYEKEFSNEDCDSVAIEMIMRVLFDMYIGQLKHNIKDVNIPLINSKDRDEIKQILDNETDEEKQIRKREFLKLFEEKNLEKFMRILYTCAIQRDYHENLEHLGGFQTTVKVGYKMQEGKRVSQFENIEYLSFDTPYLTDKDEEVNTLDYLYNRNLELKEKCCDNVQVDDNSTSGLYSYLLENYYELLTKKQREFLEYAFQQDEKFLVKGDDRYSRQQCWNYKEYIKDRIFDEIRKDKKSKVFITRDGKLQWKRGASVKDVLEKILEQESADNQVDILISVLSKDNKCMEVLVDYLLDVDLYQPCCKLIIGKVSKYKFKTLYLDKIICAFEKYLKKGE